MRWLDTDSMDMNLSKLWEIAEDRGAWRVTVHGVTKSQTWLSNWTTTIHTADIFHLWFLEPIMFVALGIVAQLLRYPLFISFSYLLPMCCFGRLLLLLSHFSRVRRCATPWTAAYQASPSMGFSRQEHWSALPFPSRKTNIYHWNIKLLFEETHTHIYNKILLAWSIVSFRKFIPWRHTQCSFSEYTT